MDQVRWRAPVLALNEAGDHDPANPLASPCVAVQFSFGLDIAQTGASEGAAMALIDTGADLCVIDRSLVPPHAQLQRAMPSISVEGIGVTSVYLIEMLLRGTGKSFVTQIVAAEASQGRAHQMILGRNLLREFRFEFDRHDGIRWIDVF